jgi:hypothetical protein
MVSEAEALIRSRLGGLVALANAAAPN